VPPNNTEKKTFEGQAVSLEAQYVPFPLLPIAVRADAVEAFETFCQPMGVSSASME
jgi:hypothetical protein